MHAAPGDPFVDFLDGDLAQLRSNLGTDEPLFVEAGSCFHCFRFDYLASQSNFDQLVGGQQIGPSQQQTIHGVGGRL